MSDPQPLSPDEHAAVTAPPPVVGLPLPAEPFRFTGRGGEYFRIWIVNLLLSLLTLGVYSAWAKVRRLQYFHRHTELAGARFDYHGRPLAILAGRAVALLLLVLYNLSGEWSFEAMLAAMGLMVIVAPWLLCNALRFRLRYSSYRGLRFGFAPGQREAYATFLPFGLYALALLLITGYAFGGRAPADPRALDPLVAERYLLMLLAATGVFVLLAPWLHQRLKRFQHGGARYGRTPFTFDASIGAFYRVYAMTGVLLALAVIALAVVASGFVAALHAVGTLPGSILVIVPIYLFTFALVQACFAAGIGNTVWNATRLGEHRFECRLRIGPLAWILTTNLLLIVLTLGFYLPWASVRLARYRAQCLSLLPASPLDEFQAAAMREVGAFGEETLDLFDIDIGL